MGKVKAKLRRRRALGKMFGGSYARRLTAGHQHLCHQHWLLGFLGRLSCNNRDCFATASTAASFVPSPQLPNTNVNKAGVFFPYAGTYGRSLHCKQCCIAGKQNIFCLRDAKLLYQRHYCLHFCGNINAVPTEKLIKTLTAKTALWKKWSEAISVLRFQIICD